MCPVYIPPRDEEDAFFTRFEKARAAQEAHGYTPENSIGLVNGLTQMHRSYADLPAGAKLSFAQAGKAPIDPVVTAAVAGARKRRAKKGFGWFGMGDVVRAGTGFLGGVVSDVASPVTTAVRGVVRTGSMALNAPIEEGQGLLRNIATSLPGQSGEVAAGATGGAALGAGVGLLGGPFAPVTSSVGAAVGGVIGGVAGLFAGEAKGKPAWGQSQSQLGVAAQAGLGGQPVEVGSGFLPGHTSPVAEEQRRRAKAAASIGDNGWTLGRQTANAVTEPGTTAYNILSGVIDASAAIRLDPATPLLRGAGMVNAARKTILPEHAVAWYASSAGQTLKASVKGETNAWKLHHMFGKQLDPETLVRLADTTDDVEIDKILTGKLGLDVRVKPSASVSKRLAKKRLSLDVPGGSLDFDDPKSFIDKADAFMANGKVDEVTRLKNNDAIVRALAGPITGRKPVVDALMQSVEDTLKAHGMPEDAARAMTKYGKETIEDNAMYTAMEIGEGAHIPGVVINGETKLIQSPHSIAEYMNSSIPLPSHKDIARGVARLKRLYSVPGVVPTIDVTNQAMGTVWRSMVLLRLALPVRVGGEEQARMAAAGYDSVFSHPFSYMMRVVSDKKAGEAGLGRVTDITGVPMRDTELAQAALNKAKGSDVFGNGSVISMKYKKRYTPAEGDDYLRGWMDHETGHLTADRIAVRLARGESADSVKAAFREGNLSDLRKELAAAKDDVDLFPDAASMDRYVDSMAERLKYVSGDDPDILAHIAARGRNDRAKQSAAEAMKRMVDEGVAPEKVVGDLSVSQVKMTKHYYDAVTNKGFEYLHTRPTNYLARSKTFEQAYWKRITELVPSMDEGARAQALRFAAESKLPARQIDALSTRMAKHPPGTGPALIADDADLLAKSHGLTATRDLLYDLSKKSQWADATRLVFPFAEAWKEMLVTWAKIIPEHPQVLRRLDQTVQGARGAGFFEVDPQTGEEMFCVSEDTEALTRRGWVKHSDLRIVEDEVLSLDPETNMILWEPVVGVHTFRHRGEMVRWSGRLNCLTTPHHRWLVEDWRLHKNKPAVHRHDRRHRDEPRWEFKTTEWLSGQKQRPIVAGGGLPFACAEHPTFADEFVELIGWVVTEGNYRRGTLEVVVDQSETANPQWCERIRRIQKHFADQGATCTERHRKGRRAGEVTFYFGAGINRLIRSVAPNRQLTPEFLCALTRDQAELLLDTLIRGDGHIRPSGHRQWMQKDPGRLAGFQMLTAMLGIRTQVSWDRGNPTARVTVHRSHHVYTTNATTEDYDGIVWCPRVRTGMWMARTQGNTFWTGNTYPGSAFISNLVAGAPIPLRASVSGLNLFASSPVMPGFGPVVQTAASNLLPDKPEFDWVEEVISPYGKSDTSSGFLESFAPAWFQKARKAFADPESDRIFANSVYDMARYLVSTGEYTVDSVEAQEETTAVAKIMARNLYLLRTLGSFSLPSAPQPQMMAQDKDGRLVTQLALTDEFRKLQDDPEVGWENAPQVFLETHGPEALLFMQPKSRGGSPPVEDALDWVRSNPDLADRYKTTYGFFAPHSGEFSLTAYERQLATGERESLSPEEAMKLGNHRVASMKYRQAKDRVGPNPTNDQRKWLAEVKEALASDHPGYEPMPRDLGKTDRTIRELADAVEDPTIAATSAGKAVAKYLTAREKAMDAAEASGLQRKSFARAKSMAPTRDWLRQVAGALQREAPDFSSVWDFVLSNELLDDAPETPEPTEEAAARG